MVLLSIGDFWKVLRKDFCPVYGRHLFIGDPSKTFSSWKTFRIPNFGRSHIPWYSLKCIPKETFNVFDLQKSFGRSSIYRRTLRSENVSYFNYLFFYPQEIFESSLDKSLRSILSMEDLN